MAATNAISSRSWSVSALSIQNILADKDGGRNRETSKDGADDVQLIDDGKFGDLCVQQDA